VTLEPFGATAKITVTTAGTTTITALEVQGALARRGVAESVVIDDPVSQEAPRGVRSGNDISGDFVGTLASARGIASHVVWRYGSPQYRPTVTIEDWFPGQFDLDLFAVVGITIDQLGITDHRYEVIGVTHKCVVEGVHEATYVLQECRVQSDPGWFVLDESLLDGTDILAY
jgi:hypothetical protein